VLASSLHPDLANKKRKPQNGWAGGLSANAANVTKPGATVRLNIAAAQAGLKFFAVILTGWKEIAAHLRRDVRTTQRWEHRGLPIKRVANTPRAPVVADSDELDAWTLRDPIAIGDALTPELRRATIQRARQLRAEAHRAREPLHLTMEALRKETC